MSGVTDFASLLAACVGLHFAHDSASFWLAALIGVALAAACWWACSFLTHAINRNFQMSPVHHVCCAVAAFFTLIFVIVFSSLSYTKEAATASIEVWKALIDHDRAWQQRTFSKAYYKVKALEIEDFTKYPPPEDGGSIVPISHDESRNAAAEVYANEACSDFDRKRPFLSKIVWSKPGIAPELVENDIHAWFENNRGNLYPLPQGAALATDNIKERLNAQTPRVVTLSRLVVGCLFLLIQLIPFGLAGWAAYVNIRVNR